MTHNRNVRELQRRNGRELIGFELWHGGTTRYRFFDTGKPIRDDIGPIREVENNEEQGPRTKRIIKIPRRLEDYVTILTASEEKI